MLLETLSPFHRSKLDTHPPTSPADRRFYAEMNLALVSWAHAVVELNFGGWSAKFVDLPVGPGHDLDDAALARSLNFCGRYDKRAVRAVSKLYNNFDASVFGPIELQIRDIQGWFEKLPANFDYCSGNGREKRNYVFNQNKIPSFGRLAAFKVGRSRSGSQTRGPAGQSD